MNTFFQPSLSSSVPVRIHVTDVNDNAPSCNSVATMVVPLDSAPATTVGTVVITDRDNGLNGTVVYRSQQSHPLFVVKSNGELLFEFLLIISPFLRLRSIFFRNMYHTPF